MNKIKNLLLILLGIVIGYNFYNQTDLFALNCDPKKYQSYMFHLSEDFQGERCLDNPIRIYKVEDWQSRLNFIKMELEYQVYKFKHRNDLDE